MKRKAKQFLSGVLAVFMLLLSILPANVVLAKGKNEEKTSETIRYQVYQPESGFYKCLFDRENLQYEAGETVSFIVNTQAGIQMANVYAMEWTKENTGAAEIELSYDTEKGQFQFVMPESNVKIFCDISQNGAMLLAEATDETPVPDKFKLINTGSLALLPDSYQADAVNKNAATQIRKVVFTDEDGNDVVRWAFCLQPNLDTPPGGTYDKNSEQVEILESSSKEKSLAKCLYYLYGGPAWGKSVEFADGSGSINMKTLLEEHGCSSASHYFAATHYMLAYIYLGANGNWNANSGVQNVMNSVGQEKIAMFVSYLKKLPVPRSELSKSSVISTSENGVSVSESIKYKAIDENVATVKLPEGITLVNETTGERSTGTVKIAGGSKFHLEAGEGVTGTGTYTFKCKYAVDFTAMALKTAGKQDVGFSYYSGDKNLSLSVTWPEKEEPQFAGITIYKEGEALTGTAKSDNGLTFLYGKQRLAGAVYQVTAGEEIKDASGSVVYKKGETVAENLITGVDGSVSLNNLYFGTYIVTETKAPAGFIGKGEAKTVTLTYEGQNETTVFQTVTFVNERKKAEVSVIKQDENTSTPLNGAVYGLYAGNDIRSINGEVIVVKDTMIQQVTTGENGSAAFLADLPIGNSYYVKELKAPENYLLNTTDTYTFSFTDAECKEAVAKFSKTFSNKEPKGSLTIYKEGEILTGAKAAETGIVFIYENRRQKDAVYHVYAGEDIKTAFGEVVYQKGAVVAKNLTTGEEGSVTLDNLYLGTYLVKEVKAPENFVNQAEERTVTISYAGQNVETVFAETTFYNDRQRAEVSVQKKDKETKTPLSGGVYGLYAGSDILNVDGEIVVKKDTLLESAVTEQDGKAVYKVDLPLGYRYYLKEIQAPKGYFRNATDVYYFDFVYTNEKERTQSFTYIFENERVDASIYLVKKDSETGNAQGDASLKNAVYGLYAREDILHPDGKTGVLFKAGDQVTTLTTDAEGKAEVTGIYLGKYYIKEITPPKGYLLDENEYDISCDYENDTTKTIERNCISKENVIKQPFQIIKAANNGKTDADLLKGAGFTAYLVSSLTRKEDGSYDFERAKPVAIGENGATEIFTDEKGYAISIPLPYGTYLVRETTVPHNFKPVNDFMVYITEHHPDTPQTWRVLLDEEFEAKLKIVKKDAETKMPILKAGAEFRVYDMDEKKYVEQVTTYPTTVTHTTYVTDAAGYLILPQNLSMGHYRIEEVTAPEGYTINNDYVEITIDSDSLYQIDTVSQDVVIEAVYENDPVKGELAIIKKGEVLSGYKKDFLYEEQTLADAVFSVYAAEDIYTADGQKDISGNQILVYAKDTLIAELTTGEDGKAVLTDLPLGLYKIVEKTAPDGLVLNASEQYVELVYVDQNTPVVSETIEVVNERQKIEISAVKKDAETGKVLSDAEFALYAKTDMQIDGHVIVKADTMLATAKTGEDGKAVFEKDLPFGIYYIKETKAPEGYVSSNEIVEVTASYQGQETEVVYLENEFLNQPTTTAFTKSDITTGVELDGAVLTVLDKEGTVIETWTSVKGEPHVIQRLHVGETYILREEFAPYGYLKAEEVEFTISDTTDIQKVEMKDDVPTGRIIINKFGEFTGEVTWNDMVTSAAEAIFGYVTGSIEGVTFEVYALEDIKSADGVSEDHYKKDELVTIMKTDALGYARAENLPVGKYYVLEKETADGFVLDGERREIDLTYHDQDTAVVTYDEGWQNNRQRATVTIWKKEKGTERFLEGGIFALCAKEDIVNADGKVILKADTVIEQKVTDKEGKILFLADLPVGGSYYVKEVQAPEGFVTTDEIQEFVFEYAGEEKAEVSFEFVFENEPIRVEITKSDLVDGSEIPGAKLQVKDEDGNVVEEWISGTEPHYMEKLPVGKYTLLEESAPMGYLISEQVPFEVKDTGEIQKVQMVDDTAMGKVILNKTEKETGEPLEGVEFILCSSDGEVLEKLITDSQGYVESGLYPIAVFENGKYKEAIVYMLKETKTLDGYMLDANEYEITFTYVDDRTPVIECTYSLTNEKIPEPEETEPIETEPEETELAETEPKETEPEETEPIETEPTETEPKETEPEETEPAETELVDTDAPETGDKVNIHLFAGLLMVSGCVLSAALLKRRRR